MKSSLQAYRPVRLLIVDEDLETQRMARVFLRKQGYEVETTSTRKATLRALVNGFYDVVLISLVVRKFDAVTTVRSIQELWPFQKLLLMAPDKDATTRATARDLGIDQILVTPLSVRKLNKAVQKLCKLPARGGSEAVPFHERDLTGELTTLNQVTGEALDNLSLTRLLEEYARALGTAVPSLAAGVLGLTDFYTCLFTHEIHPLPTSISDHMDETLDRQVRDLTGEPLPSPLHHESHVLEPEAEDAPSEWCMLTAPVSGTSAGGLEAILLVILPGTVESNQSEIDALYLAAQHLSTLLQAFAAARRVSMWDPVTGLHNQKYLEDSLPRIWTLAQRNRHPLAVLAVDLDGFTGLNERRGYIRGDDVMREAGERIQACIGETDLLIRKRGDRFQVLLTNPQPGELEHMAEQVHAKLAEPYVSGEVSDTLGSTIAGARGGVEEGITSGQQLMDCANQILSDLKDKGGDRIGFWKPKTDAGDNAYTSHPVLLVDDDPQVLKLICKMLGDGMAEVTGAANVDEAEELFREGNRYEVMITDISMPGRDGFDMLRIAGNIDGDMVNLVTSGNISKRTEELLSDAGSEGILRKPFRAQDARNLVGSAIETYRSRQRKKA